jgi:hypothetical protein
MVLGTRTGEVLAATGALPGATHWAGSTYFFGT